MSSKTADIVVAGAGVIGMSIAFQLARRSTARIIVLDRADGPGAGSTGASSAICRHKYTLPEMVTLARDGISAYRHWPEFLGVRDVLAQFQNTGMLWLGDGARDWVERDVKRLSEHGIRAAVLDDGALQERFPAINPCLRLPDVEAAEAHPCEGGSLHLLELDAGYIDPVDALQDLIRASRERGVEVRFRTEVQGIETRNGKVAGVRLADGSSIAAPILVSAGGPWCTRLFANVGLESPWRLEPTRIQVAHIDRPAEVQGPIPVTADPISGIYFRTQNRGQQIILGSILETDEQESVEDPDQYARYADDDFIRSKLFFLEHRLRGLADVKRPRGYSGLYTINRQDFHPIVGPSPIEGFFVANGMSGHGFKLAPAIGALLARMLVGPASTFDTEVDAGLLAFGRQPIRLQKLGVMA